MTFSLSSLSLSFAVNEILQELHLCDRRPLHHGAWLPDTLDTILNCPRGQSTPQSGGRRQNQSANTQKLFPEKTL